MSLPTPTLRTERLLMRPFADSDADALLALHTNPRVLRYWDSPPWKEPARAGVFLARCKEMAQEGSGARLALQGAADGAFIGWCGLFEWNRDHRSARIGYCLDEPAWGRGFATEAVGALVNWAFETLDLNRIQAETDTRNDASNHVLEKLGFVREGMTREDCIVDGEISDTYIYGLLRREWRR